MIQGSVLIDPEMQRRLVLLSGGVLPELIRLGQDCCRKCLLELDLEPELSGRTINAESGEGWL